MIVTFERYQRITNDRATDEATFTDALADAVERLEELLDRPLASAVRVERMYPDRCGTLSPRAVPITVAAGYTIDGDVLRRAWSWLGADILVDPATAYANVTYTGGWVERSANPTATNRLPLCIEEDLAWAAATFAGACGTSDAFVGIPEGAISVSLGDAAISYGPSGAPGTSRSGVRWSSATLRYRYRGS